MDKIDLDAIQLKYITKEKGTVYPTNEQVSEMMKEAIHQALVLASEEAKVMECYHTDKRKDIDGLEQVNIFNPNGPDSYVIVDKQSILDCEKYIV